ncbi:MAG: NAD-dependent epimerase/dehydratase family protein [Magnetococcales bacterium]|nr:NAD-dependent epimerase/dehydratase family protein [Magnetococcales bacterium]
MPHYLVTGGCGFIGSHLVEALLAAGHRVRVLDDLSTGKLENLPPGVDFRRGDVAEEADVARAMEEVEGCFHLAAISSVARSNEAWFETHRVNLGGAIRVFEAAKRCGGLPVVYASSASLYGNAGPLPLSETTLPRPLTAYGADKFGCELHARAASHVHGVPTVGFRFFNVYGPRQDPRSPYSGVISIFIDRLLNDQVLMIHGDGQQVRDYVYVGDVVRFLLAGMKRAPREAEVYNVCSGHGVSLLELIATLGEVSGLTPRTVNVAPRPGDIRASIGDPTLGRTTLGLTCQTPMSVGLKDTWEALRGRALSAP